MRAECHRHRRVWNGAWIAPLLGLFFCCSVDAGQHRPVSAENGALVIRESPGLERGPFLRWLETAIREAETEAARRGEEQSHRVRRWSRLAELERKGVAAEMEVAQAGRERIAADREFEAARAFLGVLEWLWKSVEEAVFERGRDESVQVQLRLPGITQRVGVADYFTVRINGDESLRQAVSEVETGVSRIRGAAAFGLPGSLFVRESAVAVPLTRETAALAKPLLLFRAGAKGEMQVRQAQWEDAKRQLRLVTTAVEKGVANEVRRRRAQMTADVAESAWKEAEARSRLAKLEWTRFQRLSGEDCFSDFHQNDGRILPWEKSSDFVCGLQDLMGRSGRTTAEIRAIVRLGRDAMRARVAVETSRAQMEAASCRVQRLGQIQTVSQTERDCARIALELAEAELQWTEEKLQELRLAFEHETGLSKLDLQKKLDRWSLANAAAWGKQIAGVEAEIALHRRVQAEIRLGQEQKRLAALPPLMEKGASTPYEMHQQELTCRMAEGAWRAVLRDKSRIEVKTAFLEEICRAALALTGPETRGLPDSAWTLLATYVSASVSACPGKLLELEAARDSVNLRGDELRRLREAGLARGSEVRETKHLSTVFLALTGAELMKNQISDAMQHLICAASKTGAATPAEVSESNGSRAIEVAPLP